MSCEAVECGDGYCSWWTNDMCNEDHEFSMDTKGSFHTCIKISDDQYGNIITSKIKRVKNKNISLTAVYKHHF